MTKQEWINHRDQVGPHDPKGCKECQARLKTKRASQRRAERDQAYKDCGLVKVRGALGGIYWE